MLGFQRLETYFLFPFALDKAAIEADYARAWKEGTKWIDGLDLWIAGESGLRESAGLSRLGVWRRASYTEFDIDSPGYSGLLSFNSIVRHVFFDTNIGRHVDEQENQLRCYVIEIPSNTKLWFEGSDTLGASARVEVNDLRLYLSAHSVGILSIGIAASGLSAMEAIWVNRRLRKLYPVDADSIHEGRTPNYLALKLQDGSGTVTIAEERFQDPQLVGFYPPLAATVRSVLYFADYSLEEYEPVLDENMLVFSYAELEQGSENDTAQTQRTIDQFLFLNHMPSEIERFPTSGGECLFGYTTHSFSIIKVIDRKQPQCHSFSGTGTEEAAVLHGVNENVAQTFHTRYYLITVIALLYRAMLLDFSERSALVSRRLLADQQSGKLTLPSIRMVNDMRTEFLNFTSYWHFNELSSKQSDNDIFRRLCEEYKNDAMKNTVANELRYMAEFVYNFYQLRTTEAVNRLALLSLVFGGGAVLTGFFGMNFGREFGRVFFEGEAAGSLVHYFMVFLVCLFVFGSLALGIFVVLRNWRDYLAILNPPKGGKSGSLKRDG